MWTCAVPFNVLFKHTMNGKGWSRMMCKVIKDCLHILQVRTHRCASLISKALLKACHNILFPHACCAWSSGASTANVYISAYSVNVCSWHASVRPLSGQSVLLTL